MQIAEVYRRVWHRLKPWPDSVPGLTRLKKNYTIAPLSNGNVALLTDMAKHAGIPWDLIPSAELARHYKPDREAYFTAASLLELEPQEVMMCAAHSNDLLAARDCGLRTGFIHRGSLQRAIWAAYVARGVWHAPPCRARIKLFASAEVAAERWPTCHRTVRADRRTELLF